MLTPSILRPEPCSLPISLSPYPVPYRLGRSLALRSPYTYLRLLPSCAILPLHGR